MYFLIEGGYTAEDLPSSSDSSELLSMIDFNMGFDNFERFTWAGGVYSSIINKLYLYIYIYKLHSSCLVSYHPIPSHLISLHLISLCIIIIIVHKGNITINHDDSLRLWPELICECCDDLSSASHLITSLFTSSHHVARTHRSVL